VYDFSLAHNNYADIILYHFIEELAYGGFLHKIIEIDYKLILSKCNIIAISGDSGSGKTTLMKYLQQIYGNNAIQFETDRYHKWERGNENYKTYTHLNPFSNHLEVMNSDVYNLKIGNDIFQVDYDHDTGKFTGKQQIVSKDNVILCGLHTLYSNKINQILDLKIFMDTDRQLIKSWKIKRDILKRGYSKEQITKQIQDRENDYYEFIDHQKKNADIIVRFYRVKDSLCKLVKCQLIIQNDYFFKKISSILIKYNYSTTVLGSAVSVELSNNYKQIILSESYNSQEIKYSTVSDFPEGDQLRMHNYYCEILAIILFYISPKNLVDNLVDNLVVNLVDNLVVNLVDG
jgi:uridine kinase